MISKKVRSENYSSCEKLYSLCDKLKSSKVSNYVLAGLDSYLLEDMRVRLFECSRDHQDAITPHSHRFDFVCLVMSGYVVNRTWVRADYGDLFQSSSLDYNGEIGSHEKSCLDRCFYTYSDQKFNAGEMYFMESHEIHSIQFSRGARVMFFEGPLVSGKSLIIEPVVNGEVIETYKKEHWMFGK